MAARRRGRQTNLILEPEAQKIADLTSKPPFLDELGPGGVRKVLDDTLPITTTFISRSSL